MRITDNGDSILLWASANDTHDWAHSINAAWPCSTLSGHRFFAAFDSNGLCDFTIDGRFNPDADIDGHELSACCADLIEESGKVSPNNTAWFVAVGQFK